MARGVKKDVALTPEEKLARALVPEVEQPYRVPENWRWVFLKEVCHIPITDGTHKTPTYADALTGIPFVSAKDVTSQYINWENIKYITPDLHEELYARIAPQIDDVLLAKNGTTGVAAIVDTNRVFDIYVTLAVLRANNRIILPRYLLNIVNSPVCKRQFDNHLTGIGVPNLHLRDIKATAIPLPPLPEQQRIVDRIESLFAKLDEAKEKAQAVVDGFEDRKAAILHKAFTGELTVEWRAVRNISKDTWTHHKFSELCEIVRGGSPRPAGDPTYYGGNIPFMKVADITNNTGPYVSSTEHTITEAGLKKTRCVDANTLLLTNSGATLGVPAICTLKTTFNDGIAAFLNLDPSRLLFYYYFWYGKTQELRAINMGAAQPNLNTSIIGAVEIDLPTVPECQEIAKILGIILGKVKEAEEVAEQVISHIDTMKKAILARAFRGELGTNDPTEESAESAILVI